MNDGYFWPFNEKTFSLKWCFGVLHWFFSYGRWIIPLIVLFLLEQGDHLPW